MKEEVGGSLQPVRTTLARGEGGGCGRGRVPDGGRWGVTVDTEGLWTGVGVVDTEGYLTGG